MSNINLSPDTIFLDANYIAIKDQVWYEDTLADLLRTNNIKEWEERSGYYVKPLTLTSGYTVMLNVEVKQEGDKWTGRVKGTFTNQNKIMMFHYWIKSMGWVVNKVEGEIPSEVFQTFNDLVGKFEEATGYDGWGLIAEAIGGDTAYYTKKDLFDSFCDFMLDFVEDVNEPRMPISTKITRAGDYVYPEHPATARRIKDGLVYLNSYFKKYNEAIYGEGTYYAYDVDKIMELMETVLRVNDHLTTDYNDFSIIMWNPVGTVKSHCKEFSIIFYNIQDNMINAPSSGEPSLSTKQIVTSVAQLGFNMQWDSSGAAPVFLYCESFPDPHPQTPQFNAFFTWNKTLSIGNGGVSRISVSSESDRTKLGQHYIVGTTYTKWDSCAFDSSPFGIFSGGGTPFNIKTDVPTDPSGTFYNVNPFVRPDDLIPDYTNPIPPTRRKPVPQPGYPEIIIRFPEIIIPPIVEPTPIDTEIPDPVIEEDVTYFGNFYHVDSNNMDGIGEVLWSDNVLLKLKEIFNNNPMDSIISLHRLYIVPEPAVTESEDMFTISLGKINTYDEMSTIGIDTGKSQAPIIIKSKQKLSIGYTQVPRYFNDVRDFEPYTSMKLYLPFVGMVDLQPTDFIGHDMKIEYIVDILTGDLAAFVYSVRARSDGEGVNNILINTYNGNCAGSVPITAGDSTKNVIGGISTLASIATGNVIGAIMGATTMGTNVSTTGNLSGIPGSLGYKKPILIIKRPLPYDTDYQKDILGYPSNISCTVGSIPSGFMRVKDAHVDTVNCTRAEQEEILRVLTEGIII